MSSETGGSVCVACGAALDPVFGDDIPESYQYDNALLIGFFGGYGMFTDSLDEDPSAVVRGAVHSAILCHDCAHELCRTVPWIDRLIQPEGSHSHRRDGSGSLHRHVGWDLPPVPDADTPEEKCGCGRPAYPTFKSDEGIIKVVCAECWSPTSFSGRCNGCGWYCQTTYRDPDIGASCGLCLAFRDNDVDACIERLSASANHNPFTPTEPLRAAFRAAAEYRLAVEAGMSHEEAAVAAYLASGITVPDVPTATGA